jgi:hypothetical protein
MRGSIDVDTAWLMSRSVFSATCLADYITVLLHAEVEHARTVLV